MTAELALALVNYIKPDIKGAEIQALHGAARTLMKFRPRMAIASEHFDRDRVEIPKTILAGNPSYQVSCGACYLEDGRVQPEVLQF